MSAANAESSVYRLDGLKWLVVVALVLGGAFANSYYSADYPLIVRVLAMVALAAVAAFIAFNTAKGRAFWDLAKEAQVEVRKVVWPTNQETNQTTLVVTLVVVVTAILLWIFDWVIGQVARYIIG